MCFDVRGYNCFARHCNIIDNNIFEAWPEPAIVPCRTLLPASPAEETPLAGVTFIDQSTGNKPTNAGMNPTVRVEPHVTSICQSHVTYMRNSTIKTKRQNFTTPPGETTLHNCWQILDAKHASQISVKTFLANHVTKLSHTQSKIFHKYSNVTQVYISHRSVKSDYM